jgi:hypothetical protein
MCGGSEGGEEEGMEVLGLKSFQSATDGVCACTRSALVPPHGIRHIHLELGSGGLSTMPGVVVVRALVARQSETGSSAALKFLCYGRSS